MRKEDRGSCLLLALIGIGMIVSIVLYITIMCVNLSEHFQTTQVQPALEIRIEEKNFENENARN